MISKKSKNQSSGLNSSSLEVAGASKAPVGVGSHIYKIHILSMEFNDIYERKSENYYQNKLARNLIVP